MLVMIADADAGNIVTAAQSGAAWGYRLLPLLLVLIPPLFMVQELAVRLGLATGLGFGELVRDRLGPAWACLCGVVLMLAVFGTLVTEFTGIAGVGEMYGLSRSVSLPLASLGLVFILLSGRYRRVERIALVIGAFELVFLFVAWQAHPSGTALLADLADIPLGERPFLFLGAAMIGATFSPWMIFFHQSAVAEKRLGPEHVTVTRWETAAGAALTQILTACVLVASAATIGTTNRFQPLDTVGDISQALTPFFGVEMGRLLFGGGMVAASMMAAVVSSMAGIWGVAELVGLQRSHTGRRRHRFHLAYAGAVAAAAALTWGVTNLVQLNLAAQVANAVLLPVLIATVILLAATALPPAVRLHGWYLWLVTGVCSAIGVAGLLGATG